MSWHEAWQEASHTPCQTGSETVKAASQREVSPGGGWKRNAEKIDPSHLSPTVVDIIPLQSCGHRRVCDTVSTSASLLSFVGHVRYPFPLGCCNSRQPHHMLLRHIFICMSPGKSTTMFCFSSHCIFANFHQVHVLNCSEKHALTLHRGDRSSISFCGGSHGLYSMRYLNLNLSLHALHDSQRLSSCLFPACCTATCMFSVSFCVCPQRARDPYFHPSRLSTSLPVDVKPMILPH